MSDNDDFVSFDKALRDLKLQSEQLKKMVSQGDIRAFRVGDTMQFRAEDVRALGLDEAEEELVFADALEDDTGMVTEELSEEDTLLVEDDLEEEEDDEPRVTRSRRDSIASVQQEKAESPIWAAVAILTFVALLWGALLSWDVTIDAKPGSTMFNGLFEKK